MYRFSAFALLVCVAAAALAQTANGPAKPAEFTVKYVEEGTVYLDAGSNAGLREGMTLVIRRARTFGAASGDGQFKGTVVVARLKIISVSSTSAMCQVHSRSTTIQRGDIAELLAQGNPNRAGAQISAPGAQSLNQAMRTSVLSPAMATMGNDNARPAPTPAASGAQISIADAARANRARLEQQRRAAESTNPSATLPTQAIVKSVPQSVAEAARTKQANQQPDTALATSVPAPVQARTSKAAGTSSEPARDTVKLATKTPAATPAVNPPSTDAKAVPAGNRKAAAPENANAAATSANPVVARQSPPQSSPRPAQEVQQNNRIASPPTQKTAGALQAGNAPAVSAPAASLAGPRPVAEIQSAAGAGVPGKTAFSVKYVAEDAVYIDAGKNAGLSEGMGLTIKKADGVIAELAVVSVSNTSAVCEIRNKTADIQRGDVALLSQGDQDKMAQTQAMGPTRKYPQVVAFSQGDPLDEEVRESVPRPPLPEVNRARGRIGLDYTFINNTGTGATQSMQLGAVVRADITRIGGSYWNLNGYWRGRLNTFSSSSSPQPQSVFDLINRTYTIGFTYVNPNSHWTAGVGRLYLPWAPSLDTTDGGYLGRRFGSHTTIGVFGGTTPDPTSFDYNPDRRTAGTFVAVEAGSFDKLRFTTAEGVAVSSIGWREDRQFVFGENGLFYKRFLSIYHSAQADIQRLPTGGKTEGLSRSFATLRVQPFSRFSIDVNHNYFRDVPTFDPALVGTGLLDKFLFQGVSVGSRLELPMRISIYDNFGLSNRSGDPHSSLNQLYGLTVGRLWKTGLRGDVRYSKFTSSFGQGNYRAASLSRSFGEVFRVEVNAGQQNFLSSIGTPTDYRLLGTTVDLNFGGHYFVESSMNLQRSSQQNFQQWLITTGYRFDSRKGK